MYPSTSPTDRDPRTPNSDARQPRYLPAIWLAIPGGVIFLMLALLNSLDWTDSLQGSVHPMLNMIAMALVGTDWIAAIVVWGVLYIHREQAKHWADESERWDRIEDRQASFVNRTAHVEDLCISVVQHLESLEGRLAALGVQRDEEFLRRQQAKVDEILGSRSRGDVVQLVPRVDQRA